MTRAQAKDDLIDALRTIERLEYLHKLDHSLADQWQAKVELLQWRLDTIEALICDKELCGHYLAEEIRDATTGRLDYLRDLERTAEASKS